MHNRILVQCYDIRPSYFGRLSEAFIQSLDLQGRPINDDEVQEFKKNRNSQAPQPPTVFFVSFDVSLLDHWAHEFSVVF